MQQYFFVSINSARDAENVGMENAGVENAKN